MMGQEHSDSHESTFEALEPEVKEDFAEAMRRFLRQNGDDEAWRPVWTLIKPRSIVSMVELGQHCRRLFLKRKRIGASAGRTRASERVVNEHRFVQRVQNAMPPIRGISALTPLSVYPDLLVQVYDYIDGPSLQDLILRAGLAGGSGRRRVLRLVGLAARWLSSFQESIGTSSISLDLSHFTGNYTKQWDMFRRRHARLAGKFRIKKLLAWAGEEYGHLRNCDRVAILSHGDFGPFNMLVSKHRGLVVIDFENSGSISSRLMDACYFMHQLWKLLFNPLISRSFVAKAMTTFKANCPNRRMCSKHLVRLENARRYMGALAYLGGERTPRHAVSSWHDRWFARACLRGLRQLMAGVPG